MDKKPLIALLMGMKKDKGSKGSPPMKDDDADPLAEPEMGDGEGRVAAAEEILSAVNSGDAEALAEALLSFVEQC